LDIIEFQIIINTSQHFGKSLQGSKDVVGSLGTVEHLSSNYREIIPNIFLGTSIELGPNFFKYLTIKRKSSGRWILFIPKGQRVFGREIVQNYQFLMHCPRSKTKFFF